MQSHVAFLRGINLGKRRVTNAELVAVIERLGFQAVSAYQAAGNIMLIAEDATQAEQQLSTGLEAALGYSVSTFVRSAQELRQIAATERFNADPAQRGKLQVTLLAAEPAPDAVRHVEALSTASDLLRVVGREWYWWPAGPVTESKLDFKRVERQVGIGTTRTAGTIARIARKFASQ